MDQQSVTILSLSQLIRQSLPLTAASFIPSSQSKPKPKPKPNPKNNRSDEQKIEFLNSPNPKTLKPLNGPTILIGTLNLPIHKNLASLNLNLNSGSGCCKVSCFLFCDDGFSICCDFLDFHPRVIGKKIRVLAWNYIPFKCGEGFLEIIKWDFVEFSGLLVSCELKFESFSLNLEFLGNVNGNCNAKYYVHGVVESVSPVTVVPCSVGGNDGKGASLVCGFLTKVLVCECKSCSCSDPGRALCGVYEGHSIDSFTKSFIVYFYDFASCWHPVVSRLVGKYVSLTGLKKKLIFIGKEESQLMYVTSEKSKLHLPRLRDQFVLLKKSNILGKGECGDYTGIVTEIYMQGMVVEFDKKVMLLLTDQLLNFTHSLRVGAIVSVRNVHFVHPNFSWTKLLVLGACIKTSIYVNSFSPMKTGCNIQRHSGSLLRKFIDSLSFSAKMWVLLTISCFKRKFYGILSEKDILGSKHKQGVAQKYCTSCLPSSVVRLRHGIFTEYCKHDSCGCGSEPDCSHLKLVVPMSSFISHCEATWIKMRAGKTDSNIVSNNNRNSPLTCGQKSFNQPTKRMLQSQDIDMVLLGSLRNSLSSGRLQLADATGSIDSVIPNLPSSWSIGTIYQVYDFTVVMEGISDREDHLETVPSGLFSCKSIFDNAISVKGRNMAIYLHCRLKDELYRNRAVYPGFSNEENFEDLSGRFHFLNVTHKFPVLQKFQGDQIVTERLRIYAEAIILPWDLLLPEKNGDHVIAISETLSCDSTERYTRSYEKRSKRCKTIEASSVGFSDAGNDSAGSSTSCLNPCSKIYNEKICFGSSHPLEISCITVFSKETLFNCRNDNAKITSSSNSGVRKVLLEFDQGSFCKFQSLKIGGYYIIKHHKEDRYCTIKCSNDMRSSKIVITSRASLLSISFSSQEALLKTDQTPLIHETFFSNKMTLPEDSHRVEHPILRFIDACPQSCSDIKIILSPESLGFLEGNINILGQGLVKPIVSFEELTYVSECMTRSVQSLQTPNLDVFLPKGKLISLHGHVVGFHSTKSIIGDYAPNFNMGITQSACIHVLVKNHMVKVFGNLSKHALPVGFGAGVNATFHRILITGRQNEILLIPASVIVISSVLVVYEGSCNIFSATLEFPNIPSKEVGPVSLISELDKCSDHMLLQLHCKIIAVYILMLEKSKKAVHSHPIAHIHSSAVNIPLAGFILDDGSSLCCCWTNNEKALTLLQLDKEYDTKRKSSRGLKKTLLTKSRNPNSVKLDKIVQQYGKVVMRNCGSTSDSCFQDIIVSFGSNKFFSWRDEAFLKSSILNACFRSTLWTVVGRPMDSTETERLENQLTSLNMPNLPMRNIWGVDFTQSNPVTEARSIIEELNMK
ncbi:CST complex subunit CTC1 [Apium graveolens]|uniref:CST complex subunit CTC1 n=1 Tax=Apium graveolens TaxID=4045 RepID=UPI003D79C2F5